VGVLLMNDSFKIIDGYQICIILNNNSEQFGAKTLSTALILFDKTLK
jgi:hypothetical protein